MSNYLNVANGGLVFLLCGIVVLYVLVQAVVFMRKAWNRGIELGMEKGTLKKVMVSSSVFSIIPSLPILMVLLVLMPNLGKYFSWLRLSVIGSGVYENMAANVTAKSFGLESIADPNFTLPIFVSAMWVMTIGIIWGPLYTAIGSKYIQKGMDLLKGKQEKNFNDIFAVMLLALLAVFGGTYLASPFKMEETGAVGLVPLLVMIVAGLVTWILEIVVKKMKKNTLREFAFPISLIVGMASAVLFTIILS